MKALVFGGGGSKGSYEMGVWTALNELGQEFHIAAGTSIGSINAAFYVQKDYDIAKTFWENLSMDDVMENGISLDRKLVSIAEDMDSVRPFIRSYLTYKGADVTPFINNLKKYANEDKFFGSDIDFALMTVKFPSMAPVEKSKSDILPGTLWSWINASCACFPVFPLASIDGQSYIDGGYYDKVPVASAFKLGAEEVVAVDLNTEYSHGEYNKHPFVKYIYPSQDLGMFMSFDHETLMKNMEIGYRDTLKRFGRLYGKKYSFTVKEDKREYFTLLAYRFMRRLSTLETVERGSGIIINKNAVSARCTEALTQRLYYGNTLIDYLAAALEVCADFFRIDNGEIQEMDTFCETLLCDISESGFQFSSSTQDNLTAIKKLVNNSNKRHLRELEASFEEYLIILAVFMALCE